MRNPLFLFLFLMAGVCHADCDSMSEEQLNRDGSRVRLLEKQCNEQQQRIIKVQIKPPHSVSYRTVLTRTQNTEMASTGGGHLRDIEGDGFFEYEEIGGCAAPNCDGTVFKLTRDHKGFYRFFSGNYAELLYIPGFYVESGRVGGSSWERHLYRIPRQAGAAISRHPLYSITIDGFSEYDAKGTPCLISIRKHGRWVEYTPKNKHILQMCELYGPDYAVNPPLLKKED